MIFDALQRCVEGHRSINTSPHNEVTRALNMLTAWLSKKHLSCRWKLHPRQGLNFGLSIKQGPVN
jgi:hypothetical protein